MKRILPAVCFACAAAVAVGAQSTTPTTQPPTDRPQDQSRTSSADRGKSVTLTGCVRQGDEANTFVLANVDASELKRATGQTGAQTGTSAGTTTGTTTGSTPGSTSGTATGTTGGTTAGSADRMGRGDDAQSVQLVDSGNANLSKHVGHRVRVTGTMAAPGMDSDRSPSSTSATGTTGAPSTSDTTARTGEYGADKDKDKDKNKHKVKVQSVQHISETCQ